jgi:hypothetical protein
VAPYSCLSGTALNVHDNVNDTAVAEAVTPSNWITVDVRPP